MGTRNPTLLRSHWIINNQLNLPWVGIDNGQTTVRGLIQLTLPITIFLDTLFTDTPGFTSRSMKDERFSIYNSMEGVLQTMGVDGKSCLLRTICEMQENPIGEFSVVGEIITILLNPKTKGRNDFLHEYMEAERLGQMANVSCAREYPSCPVSLFNLFEEESETLGNFQDEPTTEEPYVIDPLQELDDYVRKHAKSGHQPPKSTADERESLNSIDF